MTLKMLSNTIELVFTIKYFVLHFQLIFKKNILPIQFESIIEIKYFYLTVCQPMICPFLKLKRQTVTVNCVVMTSSSAGQS